MFLFVMSVSMLIAFVLCVGISKDANAVYLQVHENPRCYQKKETVDF